ncbi:hypothetical protein K9L97_00275 [Candidatus Woesearchaeota archaeon]|nr:hypothetical protein [Candidatus Woesearchaeota archaeon]
MVVGSVDCAKDLLKDVAEKDTDTVSFNCTENLLKKYFPEKLGWLDHFKSLAENIESSKGRHFRILRDNSVSEFDATLILPLLKDYFSKNYSYFESYLLNLGSSWSKDYYVDYFSESLNHIDLVLPMNFKQVAFSNWRRSKSEWLSMLKNHEKLNSYFSEYFLTEPFFKNRFVISVAELSSMPNFDSLPKKLKDEVDKYVDYSNFKINDFFKTGGIRTGGVCSSTYNVYESIIESVVNDEKLKYDFAAIFHNDELKALMKFYSYPYILGLENLFGSNGQFNVMERGVYSIKNEDKNIKKFIKKLQNNRTQKTERIGYEFVLKKPLELEPIVHLAEFNQHYSKNFYDKDKFSKKLDVFKRKIYEMKSSDNLTKFIYE